MWGHSLHLGIISQADGFIAQVMKFFKIGLLLVLVACCYFDLVEARGSRSKSEHNKSPDDSNEIDDRSGKLCK